MVRSCFALLVAAASLVGPPALAQDAADLVVRLNRLEGQVRQLSGDVERLQFENRQVREQLRKFQEDVEFRLQESAGTARPARPAATPGAPPAPAPGRRGDAFDPAGSPNAPGTPRQLGATAPSGPLPLPGAALGNPAQPSANAPAGAPGSIADIIKEDGPPGSGGPLDLGAVNRPEAGAAPAAPRAGPSVAATGTGDSRADYDAAYAYLLQKQYEQAEMAFRQFIQSHPRDRLVPDATFWLGESYLQRNRHREAAEQFLKVSTEYARSSKAADAMLKLGVALNALGAREQACATFAELERKFPQAAGSVRQGVEREQRRARCAA